jgi:asparagine N-glycosylation enzyme membrane subunit Stt3
MVKKKSQSKTKVASKTKKLPSDKKKVTSGTKTKKSLIKKPKEFIHFKDLFTKKNIITFLIPFFLIIIAMYLAYDFRDGPIHLNGLKDNVESNTYNQIRTLVSADIDMKYPNLNPQNREIAINNEMEKIILSGVMDFGNGDKLIISDIVEQNFQFVKSAFQFDDGQTYLNAIDPYHFYRLTSNYVENGHTGNTIKIIDGKETPWLDYKLSPIGVRGTESPQFHIWLESILFKLNGIDENSPESEKTTIIFLIPVIFAMLSVIPAFFIIRNYSNDLFAFMGSLLLISIGTFVSRTVAGFVDTDAYNVFFPLLVILFIVYSFSFKDKLKTIIFGAMAGITTAIYLWAWSSGWFIPLFILISLSTYLAYLLVINIIEKKKFKEIQLEVINLFLVIVSYTVSTWIFTWIFLKRDLFYIIFKSLFSSISGIASISSSNIWPNVFTSVAELNPASFPNIIDGVGGTIYFVIAMLALVLMSLDFKKKGTYTNIISIIVIILSTIWFMSIVFLNSFVYLTANNSLLFLVLLFLPVGFSMLLSLFERNKNKQIFLVVLLSVWMAGTIFMSLNGSRFILLLAPAFAISFALGAYQIAKIINNFISKEFKLKREVPKNITGYILLSLIFFFSFIPLYNQANAISDNNLPNFDDAWYSSMYKIKAESSEDAIITSWWDFGHFFTAIANRGVTFDGGSQTTPASHWVGKLLSENDEEISIDILRMLVCGNNQAHNTMLSFTNSTSADSVKVNKIIYDTFGKNKNETINVLRENKYYNFSEENITNIMNYLYCDNPVENYLITSGDMVGKAGVWAHWGLWDFTKKYTHDNYNRKSVEEIAFDIDENLTLIQNYVNQLEQIDQQVQLNPELKRDDLINRWFADYPSYMGSYNCNIEKNDIIACQITFNPRSSILGGILSEQDVNICSGTSQSNIRCTILTQTNLTSGDTFTTNLFNQFYFNTMITSENLEIEKLGRQDSQIDFLILSSENQYSAFLAQSPLGSSLFTKLFYLDGFSTNYFEKFDEVQTVTGLKVQVWKVDWESLDIKRENLTSNIGLAENIVVFDELNMSLEDLEELIGEDIQLLNFSTNSNDIRNNS